jgi:hypothetical protein
MKLLGHHQRALEVIHEAIRLDLAHPHSYEWILSQIYFFNRDYEKVIQVLIGGTLRNSLAYLFVTAAYAYLDRIEDAKIALESFVKIRMDEFNGRNIAVEQESLNELVGGFQNMWRHDSDWQQLVEGMRKAEMKD